MIKNLRHLTVIPALAALLAVGSCATQEVERISPVMGSEGTGALLFAVKGVPGSNEQQPYTKGTPFTPENCDDSLKKFGGLYITTYLNDPKNDPQRYFTDTLVAWPGQTADLQWPTTATWSSGSTYYWPKTLPLDFWSIAPKQEIGKSVAAADSYVQYTGHSGKIVFNYTTQKREGQDATVQNDLMVSNDPGVVFGMGGHVSEGNTYGVLSYKHVLSGVRFKAGKVSEGELTSITIKGVKSKASFAYDPSQGESAIAWTNLSDATDFTQQFKAQLNRCPEIEKDADYQMITDYKVGNDTVKNRTFMFIPQEVATETDTIKIDVLFDGDLYEDVPLVKAGDTDPDHIVWKPGTIYTYILNIEGGNVYVELEEDFDQAVKKNVVAVNTGLQDSYMRVAVVANWVDKDKNIVASCDWINGNVEGKGWGTTDAKWLLGSDGYFYYVDPIHRRTKTAEPTDEDEDYYTCYTTSDLFESFTPGFPPTEGLDLEMIIIAQAIQYDKNHINVSTYWKGVDASKLTDSFNDDLSVFRGKDDVPEK